MHFIQLHSLQTLPAGDSILPSSTSFSRNLDFILIEIGKNTPKDIIMVAFTEISFKYKNHLKILHMVPNQTYELAVYCLLIN